MSRTISRCAACGRAPATRMVDGRAVCGKLAHRVDSWIQQKAILGTQRRHRLALGEAEDDEARLKATDILKKRLKSIFRGSK